MERRFFSAAPITGLQCRLTGTEAHHLARVLRASVGDEVVLFDNSGCEFIAHVTAINKHEVLLSIDQKESVGRELPCALHVGVALPKGDRQKWLIEKAVELGVTELTPLRAVHGVAQPTSEAIERLQRQVIEASKQCARNRLMTIHTPRALDEFCRTVSSTALRLIAHPQEAMPLEQRFATNQPLVREAGVIVAIGPEGGWAETELITAADCGWLPVSLGKRILRIETAVCAVAAIAASWMERA
jgi:16S rRNA (uracil1498-N3)-methyltransferase